MQKNMKKGNQSQIPSRAIFSIKFQVKVFGLVIGSTGKKVYFSWGSKHSIEVLLSKKQAEKLKSRKMKEG